MHACRSTLEDPTGLALRVYERSCRLARSVDWAALAQLTPAEAALRVNRRLLETITE